ncbi:MAG: DUF3853 family protein [Paludibacteraceae bacterium]|nr:DUF3853 family protein [Paludibacteraceae bacterium]
MEYNDDTPVWQLSVGELREIIKSLIISNLPSTTNDEQEVYYGIKGIAKSLGVSERTAQRYKSNGELEGTITQVGRTIVFDKSRLKKSCK